MSHGVLGNSPNAAMNKTVLDKYLALPVPADKIQATYIWIDGTGEGIRAKDRTLTGVVKDVSGKFGRRSIIPLHTIPVMKTKSSRKMAHNGLKICHHSLWRCQMPLVRMFSFRTKDELIYLMKKTNEAILG